MCGIYRVFDPSSHVSRNVLDFALAWQLFNEHQASADLNDVLMLCLALSRRREAEPA